MQTGSYSRKTRRPIKFPFELVKDARVMRENGYEYQEIADALYELHRDRLSSMGLQGPRWITVRDWVQYFCRVSG